MGFRFWRRIKIAPGVTLNLSKSGGSVSIGTKGAKFTLGRGRARTTVGIPGTGLFYTQRLKETKREDGSRWNRQSGTEDGVVTEDSQLARRLSLGLLDRLTISNEEKAFVEGCRLLVMGEEESGYERLKEASTLADASYLLGFLAIKSGKLTESEDFLKKAAEKEPQLGEYFSKYGVSALMTLPITNEITARVGADLRGVLLGLVEVYQRKHNWEEAISCLRRLQTLEPDDVVVKLSLAELLMDLPEVKNLASLDDTKSADHDQARGKGTTLETSAIRICREIVELTEGVGNESPVHTALLLYKARALRKLGLLEAAKDILTLGLRRKKGRSEELLKALRYERAVVYEELGWKGRAKKEYEKLFAEDPDYEDVAKKLGL